MDALTGFGSGPSAPSSGGSVDLARGSKVLHVVQIGEKIRVSGSGSRSIATLWVPDLFCSLGTCLTSEGGCLYAAHTNGIRLWSHDFTEYWDLQTLMPWGRTLTFEGETLVATGHCRTEWQLHEGTWIQVSEKFSDLL